MVETKNMFTEQSAEYAQFRPSYPVELFEYLASIAPGNDCVWDCATGNGQAAKTHVDYFKNVIATDIAKEQIAHAHQDSKIEYHVCPAENTHIPSQSVDLVTIAQAIHWFDFDGFYEEVRRVLKPGGIIAAWVYSWIKPDDEAVGQYLNEFYARDIWRQKYRAHPRRVYVDDHYESLPFPFEKLYAPKFELALDWNRDDYINYMNTFSVIVNTKKEHGIDLLAEEFLPGFKKVWVDAQRKINFRGDLGLVVGRC